MLPGNIDDRQSGYSEAAVRGIATGRTILAASTDTQPALEGFHGHGLFSHVVMEALEKAQTNTNGLIEVTGLISYVDDRVPDISYQVFHQHQIPQNKMLGSNFAIARPAAMLTGTAPATSATVAPPAGSPASTALQPNQLTLSLCRQIFLNKLKVGVPQSSNFRPAPKSRWSRPHPAGPSSCAMVSGLVMSRPGDWLLLQ